MLRRLLYILVGIAVLVLTVALLRGPAVRHVVRRAMDRASARLGQPLAAGRIEPVGFGGVRLTEVRVGPAEAPVVVANQIDAWAPPKGILHGLRTPVRVAIDGFVVQVAGDGTPQGLVEALRKLVPPPAPEAEPTGAPPAPRPRVLLRDGKFIDAGGFAQATGIGGEISADGRIDITFQVEKPSAAPCHLLGTATDITLNCATPLAFRLREGASLEVPTVQCVRGPEGFIEVRGAQFRGGELPGPLLAMLDGLGFEARLGLEPAAGTDGERPLHFALTFPAGGRIEANGIASPKTATLSTHVTDLDLAPISQVLTGQASADLTLVVDRERKRADLQGSVQLQALLVDHRAIADDKIGPYNMGVEGKIAVEQLAPEALPPPSTPPSGTPSAPPAAPSSHAPPPPVEAPAEVPGEPGSAPPAPPPPGGPRFRVSIADGLLHLGEMDVRVEAALEADTALRRASLAVNTGRVEASRIVSAFPPGLLPHLQPLRATGNGGLNFTLNVDRDIPENTDLQVHADLKDLHITRLNPAIDFETLRHVFETHFEMPDGEIVVNETGPESARWTPLTAVAPLLPIAIVTQEDGGFWTHSGVSLLHLRGSLQTNVEKGRFARGGSTLTMQLARNVFLNRHKTLSRKLEEVIVAWLMEQSFNKNELMELYLNVVEFGPRIFGIGDAAMHYFGKAPADLTPTEIAFIVRLLPNPPKFHEQWEKGQVKDYYASSMQRLLALLEERGYLPKADYEAANPKMLVFAPPTEPPPDAPTSPTGKPKLKPRPKAVLPP